MVNRSEGLVFKIKRFCVHDGPGIRTTIFLKGCPLSCIWCHSPEGISSDISIWYNHNDCIACGSCVTACNNKALQLHENRIIMNRSKCKAAGNCVPACPSEAITFTGRRMNVDEVMKEIEKDLIFYQSSGGGVTLSGGEPLFQPEFSAEILKRCRDKKIHTTIETSMYCDRQALEKIKDITDLFIADIKLFDPELHKKYTGRSNEMIKSNFLYLAEQRMNIIVRVPLICNITDTEENRNAIVNFVRGAGESIPVEYLSNNPLAANNYEKLGIPFLLPTDNL